MSSNENWHVAVDKQVGRTMSRFPKPDIKRLEEAIISFVQDPYQGDIEKIGGEENRWRRRVGSYRIFYRIYQELRTVLVAKVERRGSHTY